MDPDCQLNPLRVTVNPQVHFSLMTWVGCVGSWGPGTWGVWLLSAIVTTTSIDKDTIVDVTVLQVTDCHTVFIVCCHQHYRCCFPQLFLWVSYKRGMVFFTFDRWEETRFHDSVTE